jgi:selenoprotein W-related protein
VDTLLDKFSAYISEAKLKPSSGGRFEISVDGKLVFSKLEAGRFPETEELVEIVGQKVGAES